MTHRNGEIRTSIDHVRLILPSINHNICLETSLEQRTTSVLHSRESSSVSYFEIKFLRICFSASCCFFFLLSSCAVKRNDFWEITILISSCDKTYLSNLLLLWPPVDWFYDSVLRSFKGKLWHQFSFIFFILFRFFFGDIGRGKEMERLVKFINFYGFTTEKSILNSIMSYAIQ